jgi:regulation of enolase protein 1 (concanavalin A-like superfamily)
MAKAGQIPGYSAVDDFYRAEDGNTYPKIHLTKIGSYAAALCVYCAIHDIDARLIRVQDNGSPNDLFWAFNGNVDPRWTPNLASIIANIVNRVLSTGSTVPITSFTMNSTTEVLLTTATKQLGVTVAPVIAEQRATWTSSNQSVATVNSNGLVSAVGLGAATITATSLFDASKTATCQITVSATGVLTNFFNQIYTGTRNDFPSNIGYEFVPAANINVTALGRAVSGSMNQNHDIKVWRSSDQAVMAQATVTPASPTDGLGYKNVALSSPVTLSSGVAYRITSSESLGGDAWRDFGPIPGHSGVAAITGQAYADYNNFGFPNNPYGNSGPDTGYPVPTFYTLESGGGNNPAGPSGYTYCANENQSVTFTQTVDVAYGANGAFAYQNGVTGTIAFNNVTFPDPIPGVGKYGFFRVAAAVPDSVSSISGPTTVNQGQTVTVTLNYGASQARDILIDFKQWSGAFTTYSSTRTAVPAGSGSISVNVPVGATTPAGGSYAYFAYEVPVGGGWENRVAEVLQTGVTVVVLVPSAPSGLTSVVAANGRMNLSWTDNSNNETGFVIERKTGAGGTYAQVATVGANATSYSDGGPAPGTQYFYRVRAANGTAASAYSAEVNSTSLTQAPSGGTARAVPGTIEAEDFDSGGEGVAYHDSSPGNVSGSLRGGEDVDIEATSDAGGGSNVGYIESGDWMEYTVNVTAGTYNLTFRVASAAGSSGQIRALLDGTDLGTVTVAPTGGWQTWTDVSLTGKVLAGGNAKILRLEFPVGNLNLNKTVLTSILPSPWLTADIGAVGLAGSAGANAGTYTAKGSGLGIAGTADQFRYVYQTMTGDGSITARLTSQSGTLAASLAGVMVRESTAANSRFAMVTRSGAGATNMRATRRTTTGGVTGSTTSTSQTPPNCWVRVTRTGNSLKMERSIDQTTWTTITTTTVTMAANVTMGLVVTSGSNTILDTDVFSNVTAVP